MKSSTVKSPMPGIVTRILVEVDQEVTRGQDLIILEAMKMENAITATSAGIIRKIQINVGDLIEKDEPLLTIDEKEVKDNASILEAARSVQEGQKALEELKARRHLLSDEARPQAVKKEEVRAD